MASNPDPELVAAARDAKIRAEFAQLIAQHQMAVCELVTMMNERERFGKAGIVEAVRGMERAQAKVEVSARSIADFAEDQIGLL